MAKWLHVLRHPLQAIHAAITRAQTCPECGCGYEQWRKDCECTYSGCECSDSFRGPDTNFDDTFDHVPPTGPAEPAKGKWWLRGKCSLRCADVNCPPNGACQREERYLADQLQPASMPWLNGPPPEGIPVYHCDAPACGCEKPGRWWTQEARDGRRARRREAWDEIKQAWSGTAPVNVPEIVPTNEEIQRLSDEVDAAFAERDRLWDISRASGRPEDVSAMLAEDARADSLLTRYNAACAAQYAEVDRRRDINVVRYGRDQAVARGDLAAALQGDDWLEEHDCYFADVTPEDFDDHDLITDEEVLRAADRAYDGGLAGLSRDLDLVLPPAPPAYESPSNPPREQPNGR